MNTEKINNNGGRVMEEEYDDTASLELLDFFGLTGEEE